MTVSARKSAAVSALPVESLPRVAAIRKTAAPDSQSLGNIPATIRMFQSITEQLTSSYESLSSQVEVLKDELKAADDALSSQLQEKESVSERLQTLLAALPTAVITLDANGFVDDANLNACQLMGSTIIGRRWIEIVDEVLDQERSYGQELVLHSGRVVSIATQPLSDKGGQVVVLTDVTETRHLQQRINHLEKLSEMGRMMASLAHQIRTPLSSALIFAEHLVAAETEDSRRQRFASRIMEKLTQLDGQVRDMLIFSKAGFLRNDHVPLEDLAHDFQRMALELLDTRNGHCQLALHPETGAWLQCNRAYLVSCFSNLVENALQACEESGIVPMLSLSMVANDGTLHMQLRDNGPGIPEHSLHKVLEPFYTTKPSGTGLGLPVVYAIVNGHGGSMDLHNAAEGGLVIDIRMPLSKHSVSCH